MTANGGKVLLIADASPASREAEEALREAGFRTYDASPIGRAVELISADREGFDLVLIDCALLARSRCAPAERELLEAIELPLIILYADGELEESAIAEGSLGCGFVPKAQAGAALVIAVKAVLGLIHDITARASIEGRLAHEGIFLRTILETWPDPAYFFDSEGRKLVSNKADLENMAMYYEGKPIGKTDLEIYPGEMGRRGHEDNLSVIRSGVPIINREEEFPVPGGSPLWLLTSKIPIRDKDGTVIGLLGIGRNITKRKELEESLRRVANEKSILMKELEHRVKNSLSVVSSLLSLELDRLADESSRRIFSEAIDRIKAIASVYERLYLSDDLSHVDMRDYFEYLIESITRTISIDRGRVRVSSRLADLKLEAQRAVSVGLILNEMLTNAFKYAYPAPARGEIRVHLEASGGSASFGVEDDGVGLPAPLDPDQAESVGMSLISMLARQLKGKARIETGKGLRIRVSFPL